MGTRSNLVVALYGDFGEFRLARSYERALQSFGCTVVRVDTRDISGYLAFWLRERLLHRLTLWSRTWREIGAARWNKHVLQMLSDAVPDLFLVLNGDLVMRNTVLQARSSGTRVYIIHADNPLPPWASSRPETLPSALACDAYFIWSESLVARLQHVGVTRVEYLPFAWDPVMFPYVGLLAEPTCQVVFVGGWDRDREAWLTQLAGRFDLEIWGPAYWRTRTKVGSPLRRCWQGAAVEGPGAARVIANAAIALNPLRRQNLPDGVNMRTFEVPGCGGFALASRTAGAQAIFPEGTAGAYFSSLEESSEQIEHFLTRPVERIELAENAHTLVADGHQYVDRVQRVLDVFHSA